MHAQQWKGKSKVRSDYRAAVVGKQEIDEVATAGLLSCTEEAC
jgi:hypothetical protein